jgi:hypothetical protein
VDMVKELRVVLRGYFEDWRDMGTPKVTGATPFNGYPKPCRRQDVTPRQRHEPEAEEFDVQIDIW